MRAGMTRCFRSLAFLLAATMLAGCGSSSSSSNGLASKTPTEILAAARAAGARAATVHVAGSILSAGEPISLDMELVADKGGAGRLKLGGLDLQLVDVDRAIYIHASAAFYRRFVGAVAAKLLPGKWLKGPASRGPLASLAELADLSGMIDSALGAHGALSRAPSRRIDGRETIGVADRAGGGTLYVAATGTPYPLAIIEAGAHGGTVLFDRWNKPVSLTVPANAVSVDQLHGGR
jgi:hypothetical protein